MKKFIVLMLAIGLLAAAVDLPALLAEFRESHSLLPGSGLGRFPEQLLREGAGNHLELTAAFHQLLKDNNIPSQIVTGAIRLNSDQLAQWPPIRWQLWRELAVPGGVPTADDACDFSWLLVQCPAVPDFASRDTVRSDGADAWLALFPALIYPPLPSDSARALRNRSYVAVGSTVRSMTAWDSDGLLLAFPAQYLREQAAALCLAHEPAQLLSQDASFPGWAPARFIQPAPVRPITRSTSATVPAALQAVISITIRDSEGILLQAEAPQAELIADPLLITWTWSDDNTAPAAGQQLFGRSLNASLNGTLAVSTRAVPAARLLTLSLTRSVNGCASDSLSTHFPAGADAAIALSANTTTAADEAPLRKLAAHVRSVQDAALAAIDACAGVLSTAQLRATIAICDPVFTRLQGAPFAITGNIIRLDTLDDFTAFAPLADNSAISLPDIAMLRSLTALAAINAAIPLDDSTLVSLIDALTSTKNIAASIPETVAPLFDDETPLHILHDIPFKHCLLQYNDGRTGACILHTDQYLAMPSSLISIPDSFPEQPAFTAVAPLFALAAKLIQDDAPWETRTASAAFLLATAVSFLKDAPVITSFTADNTACDAGIQSVSFSFNCLNTTAWELTCTAPDGSSAFFITGTPDKPSATWSLDSCPDGNLTATLRAMNNALFDSATITIARDTIPPSASLNASAILLPEGAFISTSFSVQDNSHTSSSVTITDSNNAIIDSYTIDADEADAILTPVTAASSCTVSLEAVDACGNAVTQSMVVTVPAPAVPAVPAVTVAIEGLDPKHPIVAGSFTATATASGIPSVNTLEIYLDDVLLDSASNRSSLQSLCITQGWDEGPHTIRAYATDAAGRTVESLPLPFHYTPLADDFIAPSINFEMAAWPPSLSSQLTITAADNQALLLLTASADSTLLSLNFTDAPTNATANITVTAEQLAAGITATATDKNGNTTTRTISFPKSAEVPVVTLDSTAFDGAKHDGDITVFAELSAPAACLQFSLNGKPFQNCFFPEVPFVIITIPAEYTLDGSNTITATPFSYDNTCGNTASAIFKTPVLRDAVVTPTLVQPWNGTDTNIVFTANMRLTHAWSVSLNGMNKASSIDGFGTNITASFNSTSLPDGFYSLTVSVPDTNTTLSLPVEVDAVQGKPVASITYPPEYQRLTEGILHVTGTVANTSDDKSVSCSIAITDEYDNQLTLTEITHPDEWRLVARLSDDSQNPPQPPERSCNITDSDIAAIDLSALPDGRFTLTITATLDGLTVSDSHPFLLNSKLKTGIFSFSETDFSTPAANTTISFIRAYSSASPINSEMGFGWTQSLNTSNPIIDETRNDIVTVDGNQCSIRSGGSRDVTVTLSDGQRTTFRFSLEQGGNFSFCYYAKWSPPPTSNATLKPTCSNKLITLPGLDPYWDAAGPDTPWNLFDFPGFILTEGNGTVTRIERINLGDASLLDNGEAASLTAYGELFVSQTTLPNGMSFFFTDDSVTLSTPGLPDSPIISFERDPISARIIAVNSLAGTPRRFIYQYDNIGNLITALRSVDGSSPVVHRSYEYNLQNFPHHITAIKDANNNKLLTITYDSDGRMLATTGPDGASTSSSCNVFAGFDIQTDPLGRETLTIFNDDGLVTSRTLPGGATFKYQYDSNGNEIAVTAPNGATTSRSFDDAGNITTITDPAGLTRSFFYEGSRCVQMTDHTGRTANASYDSSGNITALSSFNGMNFLNSYNAAGNITSISIDNKIASLYEYDAKGRNTAITDAHGTRTDFSYDNDNNLTAQSFTLFHPITGEEVTQAIFTDYDELGRETFRQSSENDWMKSSYDSNGRTATVEMSSGRSVEHRYDASGNIVQSIDSDGLITRSGFDLAGRPIFKAGPQSLPQGASPDDTVTFARIHTFTYDDAGNTVSSTLLRDASVSITQTGTDTFQADIVDEGHFTYTTSSSFDLNGRQLTVTSPEGLVTSFKYDDADRITASTNAAGDSTLWQYNSAGLLDCICLPSGAKFKYVYDDNGTVKSVTTPDGANYRLALHNDGSIAATEDQDGNLTSFSRGIDGELTAVTLPKIDDSPSPAFNFTYDSVLALQSITDPLGRTTRFTNDEHGRKCSVTLPLNQSRTYLYDNSSIFPSAAVDFNGNTTSLSYDLDGRITAKQIRSPDKSSSDTPDKSYAMTYSPAGKLLTASVNADSRAFSTIFTWDDDGRLVAQNTPNADMRFTYDLDGRMTSIQSTYTSVNFTFNTPKRQYIAAFSRAAGISFTSPQIFTVTCDASGLPILILRPDSSSTSLIRDVNGAIMSITESDANGNSPFKCTCKRDSVSRLTESSVTTTSGTTTAQWDYDSWGRLASESLSYPDGSLSSSHFSYDYAGNLTEIDQIIDGQHVSTKRSFDENDRLSSITVSDNDSSKLTLLEWDDNGSLLAIKRDSIDNSTFFTWDCEGLLSSVTGHSSDNCPFTIYFQYDPQGLLVQDKTVIQTPNGPKTTIRIFSYFHDSSNSPPKILEVTTLDDSGNILEHRTNAWTGMLSAVFTDSGLHSRFLDQNLSVRASHESPTPILFDAWGHSTLSPTDSLLGFNSEWQEPLSGLVYLRSRFYSPYLRVFISPDPVQPDLEQPLTINRYAYCRNDPVNYVDPMGTFSMMSILVSFFNLGPSFNFSVYDQLYLAMESSVAITTIGYFASTPKNKNNTSIIVHGVGWHPPGYSDSFVGYLNRKANNQDYMQFRWSGFSMGILFHVPNLLQHNIALTSLFLCVAIQMFKAYDNINIIGHSWGTVLSKDLIFSGFTNSSLWATMGSPLSDPYICKPPIQCAATFIALQRCKTWQNIFTHNDIVTKLVLDRPMYLYEMLIPRLGVPLCFSYVPLQLDIKEQGGWAHSAYWIDYNTIRGIQAFLRFQ